MQTAQLKSVYIVYPAHGVGRVMNCRQQSLASIALDFHVHDLVQLGQDGHRVYKFYSTLMRLMHTLTSSNVVDQAMRHLKYN